MLVILFGLSGVGKTFVGQILSANTNSYFWDADEAITEEMKTCIKEKRSFTQDMRDQYFSIVINHIKLLRANHENIIVSQAFYKNKNREQILSEFSDSIFLQVKIELPILLTRLRRRNNTITEEYANIISNNFETPTHPYCVINNSSENDELSLIKQLMTIPKLADVFTIKLKERIEEKWENNDQIVPFNLDSYHTIYQTLSKDVIDNDIKQTPSISFGSGLKQRSGSDRFGLVLQKNYLENKNNSSVKSKNSIEMHGFGLKLRSGGLRFLSCDRSYQSNYSPIGQEVRENIYGHS